MSIILGIIAVVIILALNTTIKVNGKNVWNFSKNEKKVEPENTSMRIKTININKTWNL